MDYPEYLGVLWCWAVTIGLLLLAAWLLKSWAASLWRKHQRAKKRLRSAIVQANRERCIRGRARS